MPSGNQVARIHAQPSHAAARIFRAHSTLAFECRCAAGQGRQRVREQRQANAAGLHRLEQRMNASEMANVWPGMVIELAGRVTDLEAQVRVLQEAIAVPLTQDAIELLDAVRTY